MEKCQKVSTRESYQVEQMLSRQDILWICFSRVLQLLSQHPSPQEHRAPEESQGIEGGEREATNEWTDKHLIEPRKEGRKRMSCPVASSHFRPLLLLHFQPLLRCPAFPECFSGIRKRRGDEGEVEGLSIFHLPQPCFPHSSLLPSFSDTIES